MQYERDELETLFVAIEAVVEKHGLVSNRDVNIGPFLAPIVIRAYDGLGAKRDVDICVVPKAWVEPLARQMATACRYRRSKYRELSTVDFVAIVVPGQQEMPEGVTSVGELDRFLEQFAPPTAPFLASSHPSQSIDQHRDAPIATFNYEQEVAQGLLPWSGGGQVFCAMPFAPEFDKVFFELIVPALASAGLQAVRTDQTPSLIPIDLRILNGIRNSAFTIADTTGLNANVMYEIGLAHALDKNVYLLKSDDKDQPFDLNYIEFMQYEFETPQKMVETLATKLKVAYQKLWDSSL